MQHAAAQAERVAELLGKLDVERRELTRESEATAGERAAVAAQLSDARAPRSIRVRAAPRARAGDRAACAWRSTRACATCGRASRRPPALEARLASLEELASSRAEFGDAARLVLQQANGRVGQMGAVADYLDVEPAYERAVEASLGDLLQYVVVERHAHAAEGLSLVRGADAGRCGFVVLDATAEPSDSPAALRGRRRAPGGRRRARVRAARRHRPSACCTGAYVADSFDRAVAFAGQHDVPVATPRRRPRCAAGTWWPAARASESRGILATKREIRDLRTRVAGDRAAAGGGGRRGGAARGGLAAATLRSRRLQAEQHQHEKALVGHEAQLGARGRSGASGMRAAPR